MRNIMTLFRTVKHKAEFQELQNKYNIRQRECKQNEKNRYTNMMKECWRNVTKLQILFRQK